MFTTSVSLSEFLPNPKGNGALEWAELANSANQAVDLSGWAIDDADGGGVPYRLPQGSSIEPHSMLVITLPKTLFNNAGDTVRLLRPNGEVADQYAYAQSSADQSFCRAESQWELCAPSPNAPNQLAVAGAPAADSPSSATQAPSPAAGEAPRLHQQSMPSDSVQQLPEAAQDTISAGPAYANPIAGALYRGVASATPAPVLGTPTAAPSRQHDRQPAAQPAGLPVSLGVGMFLFLAGSVISGYDWMRSRRGALPPVTVEAELIDQLEDE
jgi:hypothetical protein